MLVFAAINVEFFLNFHCGPLAGNSAFVVVVLVFSVCLIVG